MSLWTLVNERRITSADGKVVLPGAFDRQRYVIECVPEAGGIDYKVGIVQAVAALQSGLTAILQQQQINPLYRLIMPVELAGFSPNFWFEIQLFDWVNFPCIFKIWEFSGELATSGVREFYQDTEPTDKGVGDRWFDTTDELLFFWDGNYWKEVLPSIATGALNSNILARRVGYNYWLDWFACAGRFYAPYNDENYIKALLRIAILGETVVNIAVLNLTNFSVLSGNGRYYGNLDLKFHIDVDALNATSFLAVTSNVGNPGAIDVAVATLAYRLVKP